MKIDKIVFLGSGGGGNLKFINEYLKVVQVAEVSGVIADRECGAVEYAKEESLFTDVLSFKRTEDGDRELINALKEKNPSIIITNVHKILSENVVKEFTGKLINLHYSYLPAYSGTIGMNPVDLAIKRNNSFIGTTAHYVTEEVDAGKIISQGIFDRNQVGDVYQKTFETGALTLLSAIFYLKNGDKDSRKFDESIISPSSKKIENKLVKRIFSRLKS